MKKNFFYISIVFASIVIIFSVLYFSRFHYLNYDDLFCGFPFSNFIYYNITHVVHGRILLNIFNHFFTHFIPYYYSIHPTDWCQFGHAIIKGLFLSLLAFIFSNVVYIHKKKTCYIALYMLFFYFFYQLNFLGTFEDWCFNSFYNYTVPLIFFFLFLNIFLDTFLSKENQISSKRIFLLAFLGFINSTLTEFNSICLFISFIPLLFIFKKYSEFSYRQFSLIFITILLGSVLYFTSPGFLYQAHNYGTCISFLDTINNIKVALFPFLKSFSILFIKELLVYILIISFLLFFIKNKKITYIIISFLFSIFAFQFSLLLSNQSLHYVDHFDLVICYKITFLYCIYLLFGLLNINKQKKCFTVLICLSIIIVNSYINKNIDSNKLYKIIKENGIKNAISIYYDEPNKIKKRYINERVLLYYFYNNMLPIYMLEEPDFFVMERQVFGITYFDYYYKLNFQVDNDVDNEDIVNYILELKSKEDLFKQYIKDGGPVIEEKDIQEHNFKKLFDREFVLKGT